ncbi:aminoglycoside phosphotransferase (APT) family kinase protein [Microbacterium endophyticum]|uniref:Aminoglycoside phosphotransferase (APT) family kinase protein n=1 Tax=Microbacterium endophyticum TaxID=1526412 RepID=A0A7W4V251_9MICO|nr:phosphotransferase [Microbacterium endophyticum]MBB2974763.1 aminoglycoside phosphotransferase (APT) family kinase protein [Microbacterium endophyticum]NIK37060.1 aminoglycoside phosphotransferase (APT) family kinase protein [Microbacterium endophyticum]
MGRSSFTLAAAVTAALPHAEVVRVGALSEGNSGRFDSAVVDLSDGNRVVVRAPVDADAAHELTTSARALRALSPGVRALLPFRAPEVLGDAEIADARVLVVDFLDGYRLTAADVPAGPGAARSIGAAIAAIHGLPVSIVRDEGLPVRPPEHVRADVRRLVERAIATGRIPDALRDRWHRAIEADTLWRFEPAVILGSADASSFVFIDDDLEPRVGAILDWHELSVGDPASDLRWLAGAPTAAADVTDAYLNAVRRSPDAMLNERARLYAELEFARWLVHGVDSDREDIVSDAQDLLVSLAEGTEGDDFVPRATGVDDAIALLAHVPSTANPSTSEASSTSMQTDAYDPEKLSAYLAADQEEPLRDAAGASADTAPIDLGAWTAMAATNEALTDEEQEAARASAAALRRWGQSD